MAVFLTWFFSQWWIGLGGFLMICIGIFALDHDWTPFYLRRKTEDTNPKDRSR